MQLRWIWAGVGAIAALVVIILAVGLISQSTRAMAIVNGQKIRVVDYQRRVRFWYHYYNVYISPGAWDSLEPEQRLGFYQRFAEELVEEALVQQEAEERAVSVGEDEIQIRIEEDWFQHYRVPPTPTPSPSPDPEASPTEEGTPLPTPTPDTEEAFQDNYQEFVKNVLRPARVDEAYFRQMIKVSLLREKLSMALVPDVPVEEAPKEVAPPVAPPLSAFVRTKEDIERVK